MTRTRKIHLSRRVPERVLWGIASATPAGRMIFALTEEGEICRLGYLRGRTSKDTLAQWGKEWPRTVFARGEDCAGLPEASVLLVGTPFQQAVWRAMGEIPSGATLSYGEVARKIGKPRAARAVGMACGANPVPYLVPCHRVVAAGGKIGGFSGGDGVAVKRALLQAEGAL